MRVNFTEAITGTTTIYAYIPCKNGYKNNANNVCESITTQATTIKCDCKYTPKVEEDRNGKSTNIAEIICNANNISTGTVSLLYKNNKATTTINLANTYSGNITKTYINATTTKIRVFLKDTDVVDKMQSSLDCRACVGNCTCNSDSQCSGGQRCVTITSPSSCSLITSGNTGVCRNFVASTSQLKRDIWVLSGEIYSSLFQKC